MKRIAKLRNYMKNKTLYICLLVFILIGTWFYWTQLRVTNIKKRCYGEVFRVNELNSQWANGKVWLHIDNDYGWGYPDFRDNNYQGSMNKHIQNRNTLYQQCLLREGL